jgi:hypothetical protein
LNHDAIAITRFFSGLLGGRAVGSLMKGKHQC